MAHAITNSRLRRSDAPGTPYSVSVIVPAFQASRTLAASIASIRAATAADTEVIVVDDGSFDDTLDQARQLADVVVSRPCQGGAARARNDGARLARGEVLLFVDSDVTTNRAAVEGALAHIRAGHDAVFGAYQPLPPVEVRNFATTYKNLLHHYTHLQSAGAADTFWSGFGAVRRDAFFAVGGFDPAVTTGADVEDIHLGYRLRAGGHTIMLDPRLQVLHHKQYTVSGVFRSDLLNRAVPWTRAMLTLRTFHAALNLRRESMGAATLTVAVVAAIGLAPWLGPDALASAGGLAIAWLLLHRRILLYFREQWTWQGALGSAAMLFAYYLYGLAGTAMGVGAYLLRHDRRPRLNWLDLDLDLDLDADRREPAAVAVTVAVIGSPGEALSAVAALPEPAPWWELVVVASERPDDLPVGATFIAAPPGASRDDLRQLGLDVARGEMFAPLDATTAPDAGWLDCVRAAAEEPWIAIAGPFHHDRRSTRHRAAHMVRLWGWRPEVAPGWIVNHPTNNAAFRTDVIRRLGGFRDEGALILRLAGFGARPVRLVPEMAASLTGPPATVPFLRGVGGAARLRSSAAARYHDITLLHRLALVASSPASAALHLARIVRDSVREGAADRQFWTSLPLVAVGLAAHWGGRDLGLLRPRKRGGMVPYSDSDLTSLLQERPVVPPR